ncbi:MAG: DUF1735 domain-containing protein [Pedobacter sp.]|nr:MAG: DUF1735 domain-containing protein [Pedobacter sp.]
MKTFKKLSFLLSLALVGVMGASCEKDDSDADFGFAKIFMPQATLANLNYAVPSGRDSATFNYKLDAQKVNVLLGVSRSGKLELSAYSVGVVANPDTVTQMISNGILPGATTVVMPASMYTMPQTVSVPDGQSQATFTLSVDRAQLKALAGKKVALGVVLKNPSQYTLNQAINKVVVIIDVNQLKL